jgi:hypothetical protein
VCYHVFPGTTLSAVKTCELCKGSLTLDLDDFDMEEFYQRHGQTQVHIPSFAYPYSILPSCAITVSVYCCDLQYKCLSVW